MARNGTNHKGGRPKGKKNAATLEKEKVLAGIRQRVMSHADILFDAQLTLARGQTYLYKIHTTKKGIKLKPELITDTPTIEAYLADELNNEEDDYYFLTTKDPSNFAIDSMFDRTFGRAAQNVEVTGKDGADLYKPGSEVLALAMEFEKKLKAKL